MTVLVTGGSGFVGRHLLPDLVRRGVTIRGLVRSEHAAGVVSALGGQPVFGDLGDPLSLQRAATGVDAVVHLAAATDVSDASVNRAVNVDGVGNLCRACASGGPRRLVLFSSHCAGRGLRDAYGQTKLEGEAVARAAGLDLTILRPTMLCGRGSKEFETFLSIVRRLPLVPVIGPGTFLLRPAAIEDVVPVVARVLDRPRTVGQTYELAGESPISMRDLIALVARLMGLRRRVVSVPPGLVLPFVRLLGALTTHTPLAVDQVLAFLQDTAADLEPARRDLDFAPRPLEEALSWLGEWRIT